MAAHKTSLAIAVALVVALAAVSGFSRTQISPKAETAAPQRIVSLVPSVTEMLFAMGAGSRVIGVSNYDRYPQEVQTRTKVGGLIDPDIERIISLKPELVIVYGTQDELRRQMERARIPVYLYQHSGIADITATIRSVGTRVGSERAGADVADRIEADIAATRRRIAVRPRVRTLLVFGRDAETLRGIYASGGIGFLHDMLEAAGGTNVFADVKRQSLQATSELVLTRAPDAIVEIGTDTASSAGRNLGAWNALASVPAVRAKRIYELRGDGMMNPGPRISQSVHRMAEVLHPEAFK